MKKVAGLLSVLAVAAVVAMAAITTPAPAEGVCGLCLAMVRSTNTHWGMGNSCAASDFDAYIHASGDFICSPCWEQTITVTPCFETSPGMWRTDVYIRYRCENC